MSLAEVRVKTKSRIDAAAEKARQRHITGGSGQVLAYSEKSEEAADYKVAGYPADLTTYPFIQAEVNATGKTNQEAADDILAAKSAWISVAASIEEVRIGAKHSIDTASTIEDAVQAYETAMTALQAI